MTTALNKTRPKQYHPTHRTKATIHTNIASTAGTRTHPNLNPNTGPSTGTATATTQHTTTAADTQDPSTSPTTATTDPCHVIHDVSCRSRSSISEDTHNQQTHSANSV